MRTLVSTRKPASRSSPRDGGWGSLHAASAAPVGLCPPRGEATTCAVRGEPSMPSRVCGGQGFLRLSRRALCPPWQGSPHTVGGGGLCKASLSDSALVSNSPREGGAAGLSTPKVQHACVFPGKTRSGLVTNRLAFRNQSHKGPHDPWRRQGAGKARGAGWGLRGTPALQAPALLVTHTVSAATLRELSVRGRRSRRACPAAVLAKTHPRRPHLHPQCGPARGGRGPALGEQP